MDDTIDLCSDADGPQALTTPVSNQPCHGSLPITSTTVYTNLPSHFKAGLVHYNTSKPDSWSSVSDLRVSQYQAYSESFYIDFITTIEQGFPWQTFAMRHRISPNELCHVFFVLVTLPLLDPDDNSKRLKVAQGARKRFSEWSQAWKETVANIRAQSSDNEDTENRNGSFGNV